MISKKRVDGGFQILYIPGLSGPYFIYVDPGVTTETLTMTQETKDFVIVWNGPFSMIERVNVARHVPEDAETFTFQEAKDELRAYFESQAKAFTDAASLLDVLDIEHVRDHKG